MEKQMKNKEIMVEPIETVIGAVGSLEEKIEIREMDEIVDAKPVVAVVSTINESPPDFKSMVKVPITTTTTLSKTRKGKNVTKRRRKCKKGHRRNKKTKRCRKSVKKM